MNQTQNQTKNLGEAKEIELLMDTVRSKLYKRVYADGTIVFSVCRYPDPVFKHTAGYCYHIELRQDYIALAASNHGLVPYKAKGCTKEGEYCLLLKLPAVALNADEWKKIVDSVLNINSFIRFFNTWEKVELLVEEIEGY